MGLNYQFPSLKKIGKLPTIELADGSLLQKYKDWFSGSEIQNCVPPLFRDFVIRFSLSFGDAEHDYIEIVHYNEEMTEFAACHIIDGKKVMELESYYAEYYEDKIHALVHAPLTTKYSEEWLRNEASATVTAVLAVQAFVLYHKPEVVPVYLSESPKQGKETAEKNSKPAQTRSKSRVADSVRKYIRLTAEDKIPVQRNYRAIQWQVRGHYRHLENKDGKRYVIYIKPHLAKRGNKPNAPRNIAVEANPKDLID